MKRDYSLFIKDILSAIEAIETFVEGMDADSLSKDDKTSSAVIRKLEIIGEAAKHVPDDIRKLHPSIPWKSIAGMRDRLIHAYFGIDHKLVWDVIATKLPSMKKSLATAVAKLHKRK